MKFRAASRLRAAAFLCLILLFVSCSSSSPQKNDNVALIIIDTVRADRLGCYGFLLPTSPNIDKLAARGTLFEKAVTCSPVTLPSVSAMLTSTYPIYNNVRYNGLFFLSDSSITLAEILKEHGYTTAAFVGGFPLESRFKVNQGFDVFDDDFSNSVKAAKRKWIGHEADGFERTAAEVNERVFAWLEEAKDERFFLMVHYFDPHWPYEPPSPYDERFDSPYNGEVAYTDEQVGKLLDKLRQLGLDKKTLVVLTGDHGEGLGAHKELTHGQFIFDTTVLIPLILYHHDRIPEGLRVKTMARSIDIMPTILDFLGISAGSRSHGVSLLPALDGNAEEKPVLLETMLPYYESDDLQDIPVKIAGLRTGKWKLVYATMEKDGKPGWVGELYNIEKDPLEVFNVIEEEYETFSRLMNEMHALKKTYAESAIRGNQFGEMDEETREKLKSLGYFK